MLCRLHDVEDIDTVYMRFLNISSLSREHVGENKQALCVLFLILLRLFMSKKGFLLGTQNIQYTHKKKTV